MSERLFDFKEQEVIDSRTPEVISSELTNKYQSTKNLWSEVNNFNLNILEAGAIMPPAAYAWLMTLDKGPNKDAIKAIATSLEAHPNWSFVARASEAMFVYAP